MNISDIKIDYSLYKNQDRLKVMFGKQNELRRKYKIPDLDLDLPKDQQVAREMAWNIVEETGEVMDVFFGSKNREHLLDELADSMSFYLELLIISGIKYEDCEPMCLDEKSDFLKRWFNIALHSFQRDENPAIPHSAFIHNLALAINHLKNRRWRTTQLKTNVLLYQRSLLDTLRPYFLFVTSLRLDDDNLFDAYLRKHEVNMFRIRTKY